jgi:hypothetical protein
MSIDSPGPNRPRLLRVTSAAQFIAELQRQPQSGNLSSETEQHLKYEFRRLGLEAEDATLAAAVGSEINRLEHEAATLRQIRAELFGVA